MFIIIVVALLLGIWRYRSAAYFKWVGITFIWMLVGGLLFNGGGTLDDPTGDGLITRQVRIATQDGLGMGIFAIFMLIALWSGIIFFLSRAAKAARAAKEADEAAMAGPDYVEPADTARKSLETVALLLAAAAWFYFNFAAMMSARQPPTPQLTAAPTPAPRERTIEDEVMGAAAEINAAGAQAHRR